MWQQQLGKNDELNNVTLRTPEIPPTTNNHVRVVVQT